MEALEYIKANTFALCASVLHCLVLSCISYFFKFFFSPLRAENKAVYTQL